MKFITKYTAVSILLSASALLSGSALAQHTDTPEVRAQLNSTRIVSNLSGVAPELFKNAIESLRNGTFPRLEKNFPLFVFETEVGTILFYEGMPQFTDAPVSKLIDDAGTRFGQIALEKAKKSRSIWLTIKLNNNSYRMYCHSQAPLVACSLIV